jgi:hypothetical protein
MKEEGFSSSTFDFGNSPMNSDDICCECSDLYLPLGGNFSWGNNIMAVRFIQKNTPCSVTWGEYNKWVEDKGGWLSESIMKDVRNSWNLSISNPAYFPDWGAGIELMGMDREMNRVWRYNPKSDFRMELLANLVR